MGWMVHKAGINLMEFERLLKRSNTKFSLASFEDCANYNYRLLTDNLAIHSYNLSCYLTDNLAIHSYYLSYYGVQENTIERNKCHL